MPEIKLKFEGENLVQDDEPQFQEWYKGQAKKTGMNPNPDDPRHFYDYRAAFRSGVQGPDESGHWPSQFKSPDHPNRFIDGVDTITGELQEDDDISSRYMLSRQVAHEYHSSAT